MLDHKRWPLAHSNNAMHITSNKRGLRTFRRTHIVSRRKEKNTLGVRIVMFFFCFFVFFFFRRKDGRRGESILEWNGIERR